MIQLGLGLISAVLGIAVQASGFRGTGVEAAAWSLVLIGFILVSLGWVKLRSRRRPRTARTLATRERTGDLSRQLKGVGGRIVRFKHDRDLRAPRAQPVTISQILRPLRAYRKQQVQTADIRGHALDTLSLYKRSYAYDVQALVDEMLAEGSIGQNEAYRLLTPRDITNIESIGMRLIELGDTLSRS
jgi:LPXTG-motif cell wall-anchored protein